MSSQDELQQRIDKLDKGFNARDQDVADRWGTRIKEFYKDRRIGSPVGFGHNLAILVIDMSVAFNDPAYKVGADQTPAVTAIAQLLSAARQHNVPVIYFTTAYDRQGREAGMFGRKIPALLELQVGDKGVEIDPRIPPAAGELVITKKFSSAFFQTNLASLLVTEGIDTVILTGCSTSGCIRAAAVDGVSYGYHVIIPQECVSDRAEGPHYASLFDINAKYGDVVPMAEVIEHFERLVPGAAGRRVAAAAAR
jgi:nicotinamidase-related amidase